VVKNIIVQVVESIIVLSLGLIFLIVFTGGFSLSLGVFTLKAHRVTNPLILLISMVLLRRFLVRGFFRHSLFEKFAQRFVTFRRFRNCLLAVLLMLIACIGLAVVFNPLQHGLSAAYYDNPEWNGAPIMTAKEHALNLWRMQSEFPFIFENYSIQWTGVMFIPISGDYQFTTISDDGSTLSVDDRLIVDNGGFHGLQERTGRVQLKHGFHALQIRYVQGGGAANFRVYWTPPGKSREDFANVGLFAKAPTEMAFFVGRCLDTLWTISAWLCVLGLVSFGLIGLSSRHILVPFLRTSFAGRAYWRCRTWMFKDQVPQRAFPVPSEKSVAAGLFALIGYTLLSLAWTYPLIVHFSSKMIGVGGDRYIGLWNMWWMKKALIDLHVNPLYTDYLFYPKGISLAFHDYSIFDSLVSVPLQAILSVSEIYNLLFLASYVLGGFGCFLLVSYLTGDRYAAFLSGLVFAFWGGRAYYTDHLSFATIQWFPYCALYLLKTLRESSFRNPILAAVFLAINAFSCGYYAIYMALFTALFLLYAACAERKRFFAAACLKRFGLAGLLFGIIMSPLAYPMLKDVFSGQNYMVSALLSTEAASLNTLLLPSINHDLIGKYSRYQYIKAGLPMQWGLTGSSFIGYTVLWLCVYTSVKLRHLKQWFWIIAAAAFLLLAMGPHVVLFSKEYMALPLPYLLLRRIPVLGMVRVPVRFMVMVMFCCSVLVGYGCWDIFRRVRIKKILFAILGAAILFEFFRWMGVTALETAPAFYRQLGQDQDEYAILELTQLMNWNPPAARSSLFQITHGKKLFHGHVSRVSFDTYSQAYALYTVFDDLLTLPPKSFKQAEGQNLSLGADKKTILRSSHFIMCGM
jgi:hypothetical protein